MNIKQGITVGRENASRAVPTVTTRIVDLCQEGSTVMILIGLDSGGETIV